MVARIDPRRAPALTRPGITAPNQALTSEAYARHLQSPAELVRPHVWNGVVACALVAKHRRCGHIGGAQRVVPVLDEQRRTVTVRPPAGRIADGPDVRA